MSATLLALLAFALQQAAPRPELQVAARTAAGADAPEFAHAVSRALVVTGATVVLGTPGAEPCVRCTLVTVSETSPGHYKIEARQQQHAATGEVDVRPDTGTFERARAVAVEIRLLVGWPQQDAPAAAPEPAPPVVAQPQPQPAPAQPAAPKPEPRTEPRTEPVVAKAAPIVSPKPTSPAPAPAPVSAPVAEKPAPTPVQLSLAPAPVPVPVPAPVETVALQPQPEPNRPPDPAWTPKPPPPPVAAPVDPVAKPAQAEAPVTTVAVEPPAPQAAPAPQPAVAADVTAAAPSTFSKRWPWIPTAVGLASGIAASGCAIAAKGNYDSLIKKTAKPEDAIHVRDQGKDLQTASLVLTGVAAAAVAAGLVGFVVGGGDSPPPVTVGLGPTQSGGMMVGLTGRLP